VIGLSRDPAAACRHYSNTEMRGPSFTISPLSGEKSIGARSPRP
jgi:hypothetical protein